VEIKAATPSGWKRAIHTMTVKWKENGEAVFHVPCWEFLLKQARTRLAGTGNAKRSKKRKLDSASTKSAEPEMKEAEKLIIRQAVKTMESFDSHEDIRAAAKKAVEIIKNSLHCIAFTDQ
jgi:hypothetical protein